MTEYTASTPQVTVLFVEGRKSLGLALVLTFFFGPFGALYVSALWGLVMIALAAVIGIVSLGFRLLLVWPVSMIVSGVLVFAHNDRLKRSTEQAGH